MQIASHKFQNEATLDFVLDVIDVNCVKIGHVHNHFCLSHLISQRILQIDLIATICSYLIIRYINVLDRIEATQTTTQYVQVRIHVQIQTQKLIQVLKRIVLDPF
jgi:hypothetical protein